MSKRQVPANLPPEIFESSLSHCENLFGANWLNSKAARPNLLRSLWARFDYLSSVELYNIGVSIGKLSNAGQDLWLSSLQKDIKGADSDKCISSIYELNSGAAFLEDSQKIEMMPPAHPGFDFKVILPVGEIKVSCKKLTPSVKEKAFYSLGNQINTRCEQILNKHGVSGIGMLLSLADTENNYSEKELIKNLEICISEYSNNQEHNIFQAKNWQLEISNLRNPPKDYFYNKSESSYKFLMLSPYWQDEQKRFEDLFRRSASNLKKQTIALSLNSINAIMIGLPNCVSMEIAKSWLIDKFDRENSTISMVLLTKVKSIVDLSGGEKFIQNEVVFVDNPKAQVSLNDFMKGRQLIIKYPYGEITQKESKLRYQNQYMSVPINQHYAFQRGQIIYEAPFSNNYNHTLTEEPGVLHSIVFQLNKDDPNKLKISPRVPPNSDMIIL